MVLERKLKKRKMRKTIFSLLWQREDSHTPTATSKGGQTLPGSGHSGHTFMELGHVPSQRYTPTERDTRKKQSWSSTTSQHPAARATAFTTDLGEGHYLTSDLHWFCWGANWSGKHRL